VTSYVNIAARRIEILYDFQQDHPECSVTPGDLETLTVAEMVLAGLDVEVAELLHGYTSYLFNLQNSGQVAPNSNNHGPFNISIPESNGQMIGGNHQDNSITGSAGDDVLIGFSGEDSFTSTKGADRIYGNGGDDTVSYEGDTNGITVTLGTYNGQIGQNWGMLADDWAIVAVKDGWNDTDILINVENIVGSDSDDTLIIKGNAGDIFKSDNGVVVSIEGGGQNAVGDTLDLSGLTAVGELSVQLYDDDTVVLHDNAAMTPVPQAFLISGFENVVGTVGNDTITGNSSANILRGNAGADELRGNGGDDVILFDAEDTVVEGGAGFDRAIAEGDGVAIDLDAQGFEAFAGTDGADVIRLSASNTGPKIVWGGGGADVFQFHTDPEVGGQAGIYVVNVAGMTAEAFQNVTLESLGLGGLDLSQIDAVVINPDAGDRFFINDEPMGIAGTASDYVSLFLPGI
jgi:Ca2+-binding RTX toxin-like protein